MIRITFTAMLLLASLPTPVLNAQQGSEDTPAALMLALEKALPRVSPKPGTPIPFGHSIDWEATTLKLGEILARSSGSRVEPHALFILGCAYFNGGQIDEARVTFDDLSTRFPDHPLVKVPLGPSNKSPVAKAIDDCLDEVAFRSKHEVRTLPHPVLDAKSTTTLHFSVGDVKIRFYENVAPAHRKNFLDLVAKGFYDRTRVHKVVPGYMIQLGDPDSRQPDYSKWGQGGPGYTLENEYSLVTHKRGTVTMWRGPGRPKSHGSQFQIILRDQPHLDFVQTPFAQVYEGIEILEQVSRSSRNQYEAPVKHVWLNGITAPKTESGR